MQTVIEVGGERPYPVVVGRDVLAALRPLVPAASQVAVLFAEPLRGPAERVIATLRSAGVAVLPLEVPDAEAGKTIEVAARCWDALGNAHFTRTDAVVGVGGGAVTDLAGFVAACWLRGVPAVHLPTSLLGMVDAAVGGKTGVNTAAGKNLVGAFHPPAGVLCDLSLLDTLPERDLIAGLAEVVKCGFIADPAILDLIEAGDATGAALPELVERAVQVKATVVGADLRESGLREILNYGHTLAHAIEKREGYRWRHGDAVAVGLVYAAALGERAGRLDAATAARHRAVLSSLGLPVRYPAQAWPDLLHTMGVDKKARGARLRFVVLDGLARPAILEAPSEELLREAYDEVATPAGFVKVYVLNGPNLGRLGTRQVDVYGVTSYAELVDGCLRLGVDLGLDVEVRQTDAEPEMIGWLHAAADEPAAVVLNPGAWSHYSYALRDACALLRGPLVEVHISNIHAREEFRRHSVVSAIATGVICGLGVDGYHLALRYLAARAPGRPPTVEDAPDDTVEEAG